MVIRYVSKFGFGTPNGDIEFHWEAQEVILYSDAGDLLQFQSISIDRFLLFKVVRWGRRMEWGSENLQFGQCLRGGPFNIGLGVTFIS